jgi:hypothetical protein
LILALQGAALVVAWTIWNPKETGLLRPALVYIVAMWIVAGGITLWIYLAFSWAPFSELLAASVRSSASAMWLVPGALLLASRSQLAVAAGLAAVIGSALLQASSRVPEGETVARAHTQSEPLLFRYQPDQPMYFSRQTVPTILGALALQTGIYALGGGYPLLAAASFATVTAIWSAMSVARGAMDARTRVPYAAPGILLTFLLTVTLTAVLVHTEIVQETPSADAKGADVLEPPGITSQVLQRLVRVPPAPVVAAKVDSPASKAVVTRVVDPGPAIGAKGQNGVPGVVLRPRPKPSRRPKLIAPGARLRFSSAEALAIPFTGEYELFRTSSGSLPQGAIVETGTPLESVYGTTNGGPMQTVAVQTFDPPIDLTDCGKVLVALTSTETMPLLASMQLVAQRSVEDGGTEMMGMKQAREETLEFQVPVAAKTLLVHAIRISFQRVFKDRDKNVRVAVERFTLMPRGR